jgi:hypothetical protein
MLACRVYCLALLAEAGCVALMTFVDFFLKEGYLREVSNFVLFRDFSDLCTPFHLVVLLEDPWPKVLIVLIHNARLLKVLFEIFKTLYSPILDVTAFLRVEHGPLPVVELT